MSKLKESLKKVNFINNTYTKIKYAILRKRIRKSGHRIMNQAHAALQKTDLVYFADFGTLLGFVRDNGFIAHDPDIDISMINTDPNTPDTVEKALKTVGFSKYLTYTKAGQIVEQAYVLDGIKMDVFYYFPCENNKARAYSFNTEDVEYQAPYNKTAYEYLYPMVTETELFDNGMIQFPIPVNFEEQLISKYGPNWEIPIVTWTYDNYKKTIINESHDGQQIVTK